MMDVDNASLRPMVDVDEEAELTTDNDNYTTKPRWDDDTPDVAMENQKVGENNEEDAQHGDISEPRLYKKKSKREQKATVIVSTYHLEW